MHAENAVVCQVRTSRVAVADTDDDDDEDEEGTEAAAEGTAEAAPAAE